MALAVAWVVLAHGVLIPVALPPQVPGERFAGFVGPLADQLSDLRAEPVGFAGVEKLRVLGVYSHPMTLVVVVEIAAFEDQAGLGSVGEPAAQDGSAGQVGFVRFGLLVSSVGD